MGLIFALNKDPKILISFFIAQPWLLVSSYFSLSGIFIYFNYLVLGILFVYSLKFQKLRINKIVFLFILLFVIAFIGKFFYPNSTYSTSLLKTLMLTYILPSIFLISFLRKAEDYYIIAKYIFWILFFVQVCFLISLFFFPSAGLVSDTRFLGVSIQYSNSSTLLILCFLLLNKNFLKIKRVMIITAFLLSFIVLVFSLSRTFLLSSILVLLMIILTRKNIAKSILMIFIFISIPIYFYFSYSTNDKITSNFELLFAEKLEKFNSNDVNQISTGRFELWETAYDNFKKKPIFGVGIGNALLGFKAYNEITPRPHNMYLHILTELGIVGFLIFFFAAKNVFISKRTFMNLDSIGQFLFFSLLLFMFSNFFKADWGLTFVLLPLFFEYSRYRNRLHQ